MDRFQELSHIQLLALVVTDDEIWLVLFGCFECPVFICCVHDLVSVPEKRLSHRRNAQNIVIDNEDFLRIEFWHTKKASTFQM